MHFIIRLIALIIVYTIGSIMGGAQVRAKLFSSVKSKIKEINKMPKDDRFVSGFDNGIRWALCAVFPHTWDKIKLKLDEEDSPIEPSTPDLSGVDRLS